VPSFRGRPRFLLTSPEDGVDGVSGKAGDLKSLSRSRSPAVGEVGVEIIDRGCGRFFGVLVWTLDADAACRVSSGSADNVAVVRASNGTVDEDSMVRASNGTVDTNAAA